MLSAKDIATHNTRESCWIIVAGEAYDVTDFLDEHPGGPAIILSYAGKDATEEYEPIHPPSALQDNLPSDKRLGKVDPSTLSEVRPALINKDAPPVQRDEDELTPLNEIISIGDFEESGNRSLSRKAWAYFASGATDEHSLHLNRAAWNSILFKPRVMVDVTKADTTTTIADVPCNLPFFIAPTGMAKLSNPRGEMCFSEGAGAENVLFCISTNASAGLDQIIAAKISPSQPFLFQLYMNKDRTKAATLIQKVMSFRDEVTGKRNVKAIIVTADAPAPGKREADEKAKAPVVLDLGIAGGKGNAPDSKGGGIGRAMGSYIDTALQWHDLDWIRSQIPSSPSSKDEPVLIGVKGIQSTADVLLAIRAGADIIWLSNHGGRSLDGSPPALYVLLELRRDYPWVFEQKRRDGKGLVEIYVDGGIRRGTDVVKAVCLGAKGVALGRPFVYALQYGTDGVRLAIQILRDEMEVTMRLLGANSIAELGPHLVNTNALKPLLSDPPSLSEKVRAKL